MRPGLLLDQIAAALIQRTECLRRRQAQRMPIGDEHKQPGEFLATWGQAELGGLPSRCPARAPKGRSAVRLDCERASMQNSGALRLQV